jgi:GNAT superfamily N-acetyltransferase
MQHQAPSEKLVYCASPTADEVESVRQGLAAFNREQTNGEYDRPGIEISLVLKDEHGRVVGGISASTMLWVMYLETLWVADEQRGRGLGSALVRAAEQAGREAGCITSQTWTLSFQAPGFYPKIGYDLLGAYDGYAYGITEYVLGKSLLLVSSQTLDERFLGRYVLTQDVTDDEMEVVHAGLRAHVNRAVGEKQRGVGAKLVVRDRGRVVGGLLGYTTMGGLVLEQVWVEESVRGQGLGRRLVSEAERIAIENGCVGVQVSALSFQSPEFFTRMGYEVFGVSDGFPTPVREFYLIKRFCP